MKVPKNKEPIKIAPTPPDDVDLQVYEALEEENNKLKKKIKMLQQHILELTQEMENVKSDFEMGGMR